MKTGISLHNTVLIAHYFFNMSNACVIWLWRKTAIACAHTHNVKILQIIKCKLLRKKTVKNEISRTIDGRAIDDRTRHILVQCGACEEVVEAYPHLKNSRFLILSNLIQSYCRYDFSCIHGLFVCKLWTCWS